MSLRSIDNMPARILRAVGFNTLDLSPVTIKGFQTTSGYIEAVTPLNIPITLDEEQQFLVVSFPQMQMELAARTRDELIALIEEDMDAFWRNIICSTDELLAPDSLAIKQWMLTVFNGGNIAA
jgi:hypothetical protein